MKNKTILLITTVSAVCAFGQVFTPPAEIYEDSLVKAKAELGNAKLTWYSVDPMSETQYLPDVYPYDGEHAVPIKIVAARGEYEPASFIIFSGQDLGKAQITVDDLKSKDGAVFVASKLDLKTVKVWYQCGNGWYSYFADGGLKLCPELLLNDEDLVKVDRVKGWNYARIANPDGKTFKYRWINPPREFEDRREDGNWQIEPRESFAAMRADFCDAEKFAGATLFKNEFKQFFITADVTGDEKPGIYEGSITVAAKGVTMKIPVKLRILPFTLPDKPCCYFDPQKPFKTYFCDYTCLATMMMQNGNDPELAEKQLENLVADFARHGQDMATFRDRHNRPELVKKYNLDMEQDWTGCLLSDRADMLRDAREKRKKADKLFPKGTRLQAGWGDEYNLAVMKKIRPMIEIYQSNGFIFPVNSHAGYCAAGYLADIWWPPYTPDQKSAIYTAKFNQTTDGDGYFGWYASQHVGVENPAFIRRQYGFGPYRAGFSCNFNYAHHLQGWNDRGTQLYKPMMFTYGCGNGVIDTIEWEAFRESQDDLRYATLLQRLAKKYAKSEIVRQRYAARKSLQLLADADRDANDLTVLRCEMIVKILELLEFEG